MKLKKVLPLTGVFLTLLGLITAFLAYDSTSTFLEVLPISLIPTALLTRLFWMYISPDYDFPGTWTWTRETSALDISDEDVNPITDPRYSSLSANIYNHDRD